MPKQEKQEKYPTQLDDNDLRINLYGVCPLCNQSGQNHLTFQKKYVEYHCEWCTPSSGITSNYDDLIESITTRYFKEET